MLDDLVQNIARLMREQAAAYRQVDAVTAQLAAALVRGEPEIIESLTRAGDSQLLKMRSRLLQIMSALTLFAETRARTEGQTTLKPETRSEFEAASGELMEAARAFQKTNNRASGLAVGGSSFAAACIQMCGVPPTTYRAPYSRKMEGDR
jgi:hypothetical protein